MDRKVRISDGIVMWAGPANVRIVAKVRFLSEAGSVTGGVQGEGFRNSRLGFLFCYWRSQFRCVGVAIVPLRCL